jgi:uncharacterized protein (TIGR00730 family)
MGSDALNAQIEELVVDVAAGRPERERNDDLVREMIVTSLKLLRDETGRGDLKLVNTALKEMRYSFLTFGKHRDTPKVTMYGSARVPPEDPNYQMAATFANRMADDHRWMVVTGAGPGIMEAGNMGAGSDYSFGVNIRLPFEANANAYIHESRLINFKYFFTRKLMFVKESDAFVLFPGGFGTQDETFELLTLVQTGKSDLHPIVMLEAPGTGYWASWMHLVEALLARGMITRDDLNLFKLTTEVDEAVDEILCFYGNYHSQRYVEGRLVLRLKAEPTPEVMREVNDEFGDILASGVIEKISATPAEIATDDNVDLFRARLHFDRRHFGRLRALVDHLNRAAR